MLIRFAAAIALAPASLAQTFQLTLDSPSSSLATSTSLEAPSRGTLIGDYDPDNNPGGTQTRPGAFGGSGNNPIPLDLTVQAAGDAASNPAGGFTLDVDLDAGTVEMSGLSLDLLNGSPANIPLTLVLLYDTFHTVNPSAIYFGGFELPLPLGDLEISSITALQSGASAGVLTDNGDGTYSFALAVMADVAVSASFLGTPLDLPPTSLPLALAGTLTIDGDHAAVEIVSSSDAAQTIPGPFPGPENAPLDVPTIIPPGETAHLLITTEFSQVTFALSLDATLVARGDKASCPADLNGDGALNLFDFLTFQAAFGNEDPAADLAPPFGVFNLFDFLAYQTAYSQGC